MRNVNQVKLNRDYFGSEVKYWCNFAYEIQYSINEKYDKKKKKQSK